MKLKPTKIKKYHRAVNIPGHNRDAFHILLWMDDPTGPSGDASRWVLDYCVSRYDVRGMLWFVFEDGTELRQTSSTDLCLCDPTTPGKPKILKDWNFGATEISILCRSTLLDGSDRPFLSFYSESWCPPRKGENLELRLFLWKFYLDTICPVQLTTLPFLPTLFSHDARWMVGFNTQRVAILLEQIVLAALDPDTGAVGPSVARSMDQEMQPIHVGRDGDVWCIVRCPVRRPDHKSRNSTESLPVPILKCWPRPHAESNVFDVVCDESVCSASPQPRGRILNLTVCERHGESVVVCLHENDDVCVHTWASWVDSECVRLKEESVRCEKAAIAWDLISILGDASDLERLYRATSEDFPVWGCVRDVRWNQARSSLYVVKVDRATNFRLEGVQESRWKRQVLDRQSSSLIQRCVAEAAKLKEENRELLGELAQLVTDRRRLDRLIASLKFKDPVRF